LRTSLQSSFIATDSYLIIFARLTYIPVHAFESYSRQFTLAFMEGIENPVVLVEISEFGTGSTWCYTDIATMLSCVFLGFHGWGFLMFERVEFEPGPFIVGESTAANAAMLPPHQGWLLGARFFFPLLFVFFPLFVGLGAFGLILFIDWDNFHQLLCKANVSLYF